MTRWAKEVDPASPLPEYPRPQMVRTEWQNLNGLWEYSITGKAAAPPGVYEGSILTPFCIESALSGVKKALQPDERLWYRRTFRLPETWKGRRVLLHFGAVDWHAAVFVNGEKAGEHKGGFTPFSFDITELLREGGEQEAVVAVTDPTDTATQARGKQSLQPRGIWYTAVSGIWQTVWLEPVPEVSITRVKTTPDVDAGEISVVVHVAGAAEGRRVHVEAVDGNRVVGQAEGAAAREIRLSVPDATLWSPEVPHLYSLRVSLLQGETATDAVESYFAMRKISLGKDRYGRTRILLNNEPCFQLGPLDQGWWPDGLYTAPTDEALVYDIELTKKLGFNMARKHVKVEPARWYYHCDRLGLLVWQDMPNGSLPPGMPGSLRVEPDGPDAERDPESARQFEQELREMIESLYPFPSIVTWAPFNEGWGQYDTARIAGMVKSLDPSRLVDAVSGWADRGAGDMRDIHIYPGPGIERDGANRACVLGEFGGISMPVAGRLWVQDKNWGYATRQDKKELSRTYRSLFASLRGPLAQGLSAAIYTQTSDVEGELNGFVTYDREVEKFDADALRSLHAEFYKPAPAAEVILPEASAGAGAWAYTTSAPGSGWPHADSDTAGWERGKGVFQSGENKLFSTGTRWDAPEIWMKKSFDLGRVPQKLWLTLVHGFTAGEVYLNGKQALVIEDLRPTRRHYSHFDLTPHAGKLKAGKNVIAIYARKERGWNGVDAGLYGLFKEALGD